MTTPNQEQFGRKATLIVMGNNDKPLDLSEMHFRFNINSADIATPNNCEIRIYNLSEATTKRVKDEYTKVIVQAGYESASYGVIFAGTIKQFRTGRESAVDTYLDILAADGDIGYNFGIVNKTWAAGSTQSEHIAEAAKAMGLDYKIAADLTGTNPASLPRGKVGFGMARDLVGKAADSLGATWSIQGNQIQVIGMQGYLPGERLVINAATGMVGMPEQTEEGIRVQVLLNPKLRIGGLIELDNRDINQLIRVDPNVLIPFNQHTGFQYAAKIVEATDGVYRVYVIDHIGDTRGGEWYSNLVCLSFNPSANKVEAKN